MPAKPRGTISVSPETVKWGGIIDATVTYTGEAAPWLHVEGRQNGELVWEGYNRVINGQGGFTAGPTPAADESLPGTGVMEIGYWTKQNGYRAIASDSFSIEP